VRDGDDTYPSRSGAEARPPSQFNSVQSNSSAQLKSSQVKVSQVARIPHVRCDTSALSQHPSLLGIAFGTEGRGPERSRLEEGRPARPSPLARDDELRVSE
jgi:hypothetical protein